MYPIEQIMECEPRNEIVYDESFDDYKAAIGLNSSPLKAANESWQDFYYQWHHSKKTTPQMEFGSLIHTMLLEREKLNQRSFRMLEGFISRVCP